MVDTAGETREHIGQPRLPAVFRAERGVGAIDRLGLRENARASLAPFAPDPPRASDGAMRALEE